jgi:hypothetical protein
MDLKEMGWEGVWTGLIWLSVLGPFAGTCEHGNEPLGFIKGKVYFE